MLPFISFDWNVWFQDLVFPTCIHLLCLYCGCAGRLKCSELKYEGNARWQVNGTIISCLKTRTIFLSEAIELNSRFFAYSFFLWNTNKRKFEKDRRETKRSFFLKIDFFDLWCIVLRIAFRVTWFLFHAYSSNWVQFLNTAWVIMCWRGTVLVRACKLACR